MSDYAREQLLCDKIAAQVAEIARLTRERDAARAALAQYGEHGWSCKNMTGRGLIKTPHGPCICGLDAALSPSESPRP